ncbi:transmembrane protein 135-like [Limulus polyphemus]|uniref:Transmembrane protein 135-like n=1 Tax=Limulus polyphemus TaxID=6850 RepID=A0ABM1SFI1_LIMPO|nr:transmembrane protein 135-like [Limulus polyphemus]
MSSILNKISYLRELSLPFNCYETGHTWTPSCTDAALTIGATTFREALKIYGSLYVVSQIFSWKFDLKTFRKTLESTLTSSCFLSFNAFSFISIFCGIRRIMGKFYYLHCAYIPAFTASFLAILIERESRRQPLALYVINIASETIFRMLVTRGYTQPLPQGEVLIFSLTMGVLMYVIRKNGFSKDLVGMGMRFLLGSEEVKLQSNSEHLDPCKMKHNVIKALNQKKINGKPLPLNNTAVNFATNFATFISSVFQQGRKQLGQTPLVNFLKTHPHHHSCPHAFSCPSYILKGFLQPFLVGYSARTAMHIFSSFQHIIKNPSLILRLLTNKQNLSVGLSVGGFFGIFKLVSCLLRWVHNKDSEWHAIPAGLLAGLTMLINPNSTVALYLAWKAVEIVYTIGVKKRVLPSIPGSILILYAASTALLFYAAFMEPHNLKPTYIRFLNRLTDNRLELINRHVMDVFGTHASKMYHDFWPDLDPRYTSRAFQETILVWLAGSPER